MPILRFALAQTDFPVGAVAANAGRMRDLIAGLKIKDGKPYEWRSE